MTVLKNTKARAFRGLQNVSDPLRLGLGWMSRADNVIITDTGAVRTRDGYVKTLNCSGVTGAFNTRDFSRAYLVDSGTLYRVLPDGAGRVALRSGITAAPMYWTQVNDEVYYSNGPSKGIIRADDRVLDWLWPEPPTPFVGPGLGSLPAGQYQVCLTYTLPDGRETGASEAFAITVPADSSLVIRDIVNVAGCSTNVYIAPANSEVFQHAFAVSTLNVVNWGSGPDSLGRELRTAFRNPPPLAAEQVAFWKSRVYLMQWLPEHNATVVWASEPLGYHLFQMNTDFVQVPGRGTLLAATNDALIIGTDLAIHAYDGKTRVTLAPYGAVPGWGWAEEADGSILLWTERGLCSALPFVNLTERQVSVAPGTRAGAALVQRAGQKHFVVALHKGGEAFNNRS